MFRNRFCILAVASTAFIAACTNVQDYYLAGISDPEVRDLFEIAATEQDPLVRAVAMNRLSGFLVDEAGHEVLIAYLTSFVEKHPDDPYGALYLYIVGQSYVEQGAPVLARYYFDRVVRSYADVVIRGASLRQASLRQLVRLAADPEQRVLYYRKLIEEYGTPSDLGLLYYRLAETYEELGEWTAAYDAYRKFLTHPGAEVPGRPNAYRETGNRVAFYDSRKNWTVPTLEELTRIITAALASRDARTLTRYQAGVNFFTRSWEQDFDDPNATPIWNLGELLRQSRQLSMDREAALDSDGDEAYLWTWGWGGLRIRTWYFYFRRVNYPPDPLIHGSWEWAGIFLGERL